MNEQQLALLEIIRIAAQALAGTHMTLEPCAAVDEAAADALVVIGAAIT
jgi:hypothetical protein